MIYHSIFVDIVTEYSNLLYVHVYSAWDVCSYADDLYI